MGKYTINLILKKDKVNQKELYPIYIRITVDRKTSYISTGIFIRESQWDRKNESVKNHPDCQTYNADLSTRKSELIKRMVENNMKGSHLSAQSLKLSITSNLNNYFDFVDFYTKAVSGKRAVATLENYRKHNKKLEEFHGSKNLTFEQIDTNFLTRYEHYLRSGENAVGDNYINVLFRGIRLMFNAAKKRGVVSHYPFSTYEMTVYSAPQKDYLALSELKKFEDFYSKTKNEVYKETITYFLLGCYTGLRVSDWPNFSKKNIIGDHIKIRATKNGENILIPLNAPMKRNLKRMEQYPLKLAEQTMNEKLKLICEKLEIEKRISTHCARKTFAVTICANLGLSLEVTATLMGITFAVCASSYYKVSPLKIERETKDKWKVLK